MLVLHMAPQAPTEMLVLNTLRQDMVPMILVLQGMEMRDTAPKNIRLLRRAMQIMEVQIMERLVFRDPRMICLRSC